MCTAPIRHCWYVQLEARPGRTACSAPSLCFVCCCPYIELPFLAFPLFCVLNEVAAVLATICLHMPPRSLASNAQAVIDPIAATDLFFSMAADFNATGQTHVPHWVFASCETGCMPGQHGLAVLADFLVKGIPGPSAAAMFTAASVALSAQDSGSDYSQLGFVPVDVSQNGASLTLDFAFDDSVGAVIADIAGQSAQAALWRNRSQSYR